MGIFRSVDRFRDLRKSVRYEVHYPAHIDLDGKSPLANCVICDISALGAKPTVREQEQLPTEFTLLFRRRCRVVHLFDGQIGVQFV
jgi:PilZ domain